MARSQRKARRRGPLSFILGLLNPIRDPSLLVAAILTVIWEGSSGDPWYRWALFGLGNSHDSSIGGGPYVRQAHAPAR